ncbi:zinc finger lsd1 subclass family protein (macronuclear) [Tetrahymena thermophila SB210]|uniref:Zinc finger lsd1 subclass family protein n=1 Tax=Tetrahymena thermophila (strain SB210) TaxID=312017 RepID=Q241W0_TETTS|nr:zinc finger lsd1 subclass family protein [Tetrahymena thermophila SB210]EAS02591.2 zinc finger lsd1 subclass family protein [Tetrahymena thermophila SB210]|eukprot:XP_001022836.2 zinc finger lsd1 subclass family protein [Tetrahymena thermophila SB210]
MKNLIIQLLQIFFVFFNYVYAIEQKVIEEFTANSFLSSDAPNWSKQLVFTCAATSYVDFSALSVFGIFGKTNSITKKTVSSLPPHWSASIRFDMLLYQALDSGLDYVSIQSDTQTPEKFLKNANNDGVKLCGTTSNDILILYNKNFTHSASSLTLQITASMNKLETIQGFVMRNLYIFIDTCHFTCATCSGPSYDQCLSCPLHSSPTNGNQCVCDAGYYAYQFQCVPSCPTGFTPDSNNQFCVIDFCAASDCQTCSNKICTACVGTKKLLNGQCVNSCPSYAPLTSGVCKDYSSTLTNGKYLIKGGLSADTFGESEVYGLGFIPNGFKGTGYGLSSGASVTKCAGKSLLGGAFLSGSGAYIQRSFQQMSPHWSVLIGYTLYKIDSWENETVDMNVDGQIKQTTSRKATDGATNLCGNSQKDDIIIVSQNFTHVLPSLNLKITTTLDQDPFDESYGIRDIFVLVDYCVDNCQNCDASGCLACQNGFQLYQKQCYSQCPNGTYKLSSSECAVCHPSCKTCFAGSNKSCNICQPNTYLNPDNSCQSGCVSNYYPRIGDMTCQKCDISCFNCVSPGDSGSCTSCTGQLYLTKNQCQQNCPPNQTKVTAPNNNTCQPCDKTCLTCNGTTPNSCTSCLAPDLFLSTTFSCVNTCNTNQYKNTQNQTCQPCHISCQTCKGPDNTDCLSCGGSFYLDTSKGICSNSCPDKYYKNTSNNKCTQCDATCVSCSGPSSSECSSCDSPRFYQASTKQCVTDCLPSQFKDKQQRACKNCDQTCATCQGPYTNDCTSCQGQLYLDTTENKCTATCPLRFFKNTSNNQCSKCDSSCYSCDGTQPFNCLSCELPRYYQVSQRQCVTQCNSNQYKNDQSFKCLDCDSSCATCSGGSSTDCTSCQGNLFLDKLSKKCVANCPFGYFQNKQNNECNLCNDICESCFGPNTDNCKSCVTPYFFQSSTNKCVTECAVGEYKSKPTKSCLKCHSTCKSCLLGSDSDCLSCAGDLFLDLNSNKCVSICNPGSYANKSNNVCDSCHPSCLTCDGGADTSCTSCLQNYYYYKNTKSCMRQCPFGSFIDLVNKSCYSCKDSCQTCENEKGCLTCKPGYFYENQQCVSVCSDGNYPDKSTQKCEKCNQECKTCTGPTNTECVQCNNSQKTNDRGSCVDTCPYLQYNELDPYPQCQPCNFKCSKGCTGKNPEDCIALKVQYQVMFYIIFSTSCVWLISYIWGVYIDKKQSLLVSVKPNTSDVKEVFKQEENLRQLSPQRQSRTNTYVNNDNMETIKELDVDRDQQTINNQTISTQKIVRPMRRKRTTRLMSTVKQNLASFLEIQEPSSKFIRKNSQETIEMSHQSITNNQFRRTQTNTYTINNNNSIFQRSPSKKFSTVVATPAKKLEILPNEKLKYAILGQEWISMLKFYHPSISRPYRTTLTYLKYHSFLLSTQFIYDNQLFLIIPCLVFGWCIKLIFQKFVMLAISCINNSYLRNFIINFSFLVIFLCFIVLCYSPILDKLFIQKDYYWSFVYASVFLSDFLIFQPLFSLFEYLLTIKYLNYQNDNKQSKILSIFKNELYYNQLK